MLNKRKWKSKHEIKYSAVSATEASKKASNAGLGVAGESVGYTEIEKMNWIQPSKESRHEWDKEDKA